MSEVDGQIHRTDKQHIDTWHGGHRLCLYAGTDAQQLRALVRQARKDMKVGPAGEAPRQSKAYRDVFQLVRQQLAVHGSGDHAAAAAAQELEGDA